MSKENIENITKSDSNMHQLLLIIMYYQTNFNGHCVINNIYIPKKVINLYISYTPTPWLINLNTDFTLNNCLLGSVKLTKNADPGKYKCSGYSIGFDSRSELLFTDGSMEKNVIIFGADMSSSVHI